MAQPQREDFVNLILQHEGLVPGQTPFRITSQTMRNWKTIHGYKIARGGRAPMGRENFLFLENPLEVFPAVRKQFQNYARVPERYGLPSNPTVQQAVNVFDQSGAKGKLQFLRQRGIDPNAPLASLFQEAT